MKRLTPIFALTLLTACTTGSGSHDHAHSTDSHSHTLTKAEIIVNGDQRCIMSDGVPHHD